MYEKESVVRGHHVYKAIWTPFSNSLWVYTKVSCSSFFRLFLGKIDGLELERDIVRLARSLEGGGSASSHNSTLCTRKRANKSYPDPVAPGFYLLLVCSNPRAMGVKGRMWHVIKNMYEVSRSAILLEGEKSAAFRLEQGVAQGSSLSPILYL